MSKVINLKELYLKQLNLAVERLKTYYKPEKIILFGSIKTNDFGPDSDLDLLVIKDTSQTRRERYLEVVKCVDSQLAMDILVLTPAEISRNLKIRNPFIEEILKEGKILYEIPKKRV